jgi:hypothetical protein
LQLLIGRACTSGSLTMNAMIGWAGWRNSVTKSTSRSSIITQDSDASDSPSGRLLRRELAARGLSANRLALDLGVPSGRIAAVLAGVGEPVRLAVGEGARRGDRAARETGRPGGAKSCSSTAPGSGASCSPSAGTDGAGGLGQGAAGVEVLDMSGP